MNFKNIIIGLFVVITLFSLVLTTPTSITAPPVSKNTINDEKDDLKQFLGHCLHKGDVAKCLKTRISDLLDEYITSDDEWSMNFFNMKMSLNKNPEFKEDMQLSADKSRTFEDIISKKLKYLMESRVFQVRLADDDANEKTTNDGQTEARKKKEGKHGHMMMMSGMAVMAMMMQLFLSKVAFLSGAALLIAKIALLFSTLSGLKKSGGSGGTDHVVYSADIAKQGWQRRYTSPQYQNYAQKLIPKSFIDLQSMQTITPTISQPQLGHTDEDLAYRGHATMANYDGV
ncbi:hypothetical protein PVAND_002065 [Polypedilum vanderplanki]|uniref:Uncharacterized protein n=1 Tax=Polypedilum vanderplanki TaxID=319348 RepID=A0A9J6BQA0_POLVA|nr:hypothetical protein PVAND_002065 [Polypedilum vanderplanki]